MDTSFENKNLLSSKLGDECQNCKASNHTGVWDGKKFVVCYICGDKGIIDKKAVKIIKFYADQCQ